MEGIRVGGLVLQGLRLAGHGSGLKEASHTEESWCGVLVGNTRQTVRQNGTIRLT
jgi:hypothetical protein